MSKPWYEYPGAFEYYGGRKDKPPSLIEALRIMERLERKNIKKQMKKEEEEKKKKEEEEKKKYNLPTFNLWQMLLLGPIVGFGYLLLFNLILQKTVMLLHIHP